MSETDMIHSDVVLLDLCALPSDIFGSKIKNQWQ
jgi:hypothetical protein